MKIFCKHLLSVLRKINFALREGKVSLFHSQKKKKEIIHRDWEREPRRKVAAKQLFRDLIKVKYF